MQDWLAASAAANPKAAALISDACVWTYAELHNQVTNYARRLRTFGVYPGEIVAVLMENRFEYVCLVHALARLGAVLLPLNKRLTAEELSWQLDFVGCYRVIHDQPGGIRPVDDPDMVLIGKLRVSHRQMLALDTLEQFPDDLLDPLDSREIDLDTRFAVVFTSGTSGKPKAAALSYGSFFYSAMSSAYRLGTLPDDKWLCCLPLYHVGGLSIPLRCCLYGTTVVLQQGFGVESVAHALVEHQPTLISLVPTMLYRLLQAGRGQALKRLRLILLGGAAASPELLRECEALGLRVAPTYGLSEAASQVATMLPHETYLKPGSVGKPLPFTSVRIVDESGESVPPGEYGEIVVNSATVMQGYLNDPDATAQTLRGGELYTGDIGYLDADGDLFVVQRRSDLIVSGGENVYPVEVEAVLRAHPAVMDACVVGVSDAEWGQRVAAAVVLREQMTVSADDLLAFSRDKLAGYKQPRLVRFVKSLPQTASGKIQRAAVAELFN